MEANASPTSLPTPLTIDDMQAALEEVPGIVAASPVVSDLSDRVPVGGGKERDISVLGVFPDYNVVRNLVILTGRFFDAEDEQAAQQGRSDHPENGRGALRIATRSDR